MNSSKKEFTRRICIELGIASCFFLLNVAIVVAPSVLRIRRFDLAEGLMHVEWVAIGIFLCESCLSRSFRLVAGALMWSAALSFGLNQRGTPEAFLTIVASILFLVAMPTSFYGFRRHWTRRSQGAERNQNASLKFQFGFAPMLATVTMLAVLIAHVRFQHFNWNILYSFANYPENLFVFLALIAGIVCGGGWNRIRRQSSSWLASSGI